MRWLPAIAFLALTATACGGGSGTDSAAGRAAGDFVSAVSAGNRDVWCAQFGAPVGGAVRGPLSGQALHACITQDLFAMTGSCDEEAALTGSSVTGVDTSQSSAQAQLSSGAHIQLAQVGGRWLIQNVSSAGAKQQRVRSGPCSGAG